MKYKHGGLILVRIAVITIAVIILLYIAIPRINKTFASAIDPLRKEVVLEDEQASGGVAPTPVPKKTPDLVLPPDREVTSKAPELIVSSTGATAYNFHVTEQTSGSVSTICSEVNNVKFELSGSETYTWSAMSCSDSSCNTCGSFAASKIFMTEDDATESADGWSSSGSIIADERDKQVGVASIKLSYHNLGGTSGYEFHSQTALSNKLTFNAKADPDKRATQVLLRDNSNNLVTSKNIKLSKTWKQYTLTQNDFEFTTGVTRFDWDKITEILFSGNSNTNYWIDALYLE